MKKWALVVVDYQRDFCDGGTLAVQGASSLASGIATAVQEAVRLSWPVIFTRDWHPFKHSSFNEQGGPWPPHCIAGSDGAEIHPLVPIPDTAIIISKGEDVEGAGYSPFESEKLEIELRKAQVSSIIVVGVALEFCVSATCKDAVKRGFQVLLVDSLVAAIGEGRKERERALSSLRDLGVTVVPSFTSYVDHI